MLDELAVPKAFLFYAGDSSKEKNRNSVNPDWLAKI